MKIDGAAVVQFSVAHYRFTDQGNGPSSYHLKIMKKKKGQKADGYLFEVPIPEASKDC